MIVTIENSYVAKSDIEICGMNVITGQNNVGKSTVCRLIHQSLREANPSFNNVFLIDSTSDIMWYLPKLLHTPHNQLIDEVLPEYTCGDLYDLLKMTLPSSYCGLSDSEEKIIDEITGIIDGKMYYDHQQNSFIFERTNGTKINAINASSGTKIFGIIQMLIVAYSLFPSHLMYREKTVLIFDECDVYLSPEWQVKFAKILTQLAFAGVSVLVSSHSVYTVEALKKYSEKHDQENVTRFYFLKKENNDTFVEDVTDDLNPIFKMYATTMQHMAFM